MTGEDGDEEDDEESLGFMVLADGLEGDAAHEALQVDRFLEHATQLVLQMCFHGITDHLDRSLLRVGDGVAA